MASLQIETKTALAGVTMEKIVSATDSADSTAIAVEYLFLLPVVVKEVADFAKVAGKLDVAVGTVLLAWLLSATVQALYLFNRVPVDLVVHFWVSFIVVFYFVVTHAARKKLFAIWALFVASAFVVLASKERVNFTLLFLFFLFLLSLFLLLISPLIIQVGLFRCWLFRVLLLVILHLLIGKY